MKTKHTFISVLMILAMVTTLVVVAAAPASANVSVVTATPTPATASATAQYDISFTAAAAVAAGGTVTVTLPSGTVVPGSIAMTSVLVNGTLCTVAPTVIGNQIIVTVPVGGAIAAAAAQTVTFTQAAGIKNPPLSKSTYTALVHTSAEGTDVASAAYTINAYVAFSPTAGAAGSSVTVVGAGFTPNVALNLSGGVAGAGTVNADGTISITGVAAAAAAVTASDGAGISATSATAFALTATVSSLPASANASGTVQVTLQGLTGGNLYALSLGGPAAGNAVDMVTVSTGTLVSPGITGTAIDGATASAGGTIICTIQIPAGQAAGTTILYAKSSGAAVAFANAAAFTAASPAGTGSITVNPRSVSVSPASGVAGTTITLTGTGFGPFAASAGSSITAVGPSAVAFAGSTAFATDSTGNFTKSVTMPTGIAAGTYYITATDSLGNTKTGVFVIPVSMPPSITAMTPASGPAGTVVTVSGKDFTPLSPVSLTFGATLMSVGNADALGNVTLSLTVPVAAPGFTIVSLNDGIKTAASSTFTVTLASASVAPAQAFASITGKYTKVWSFNAAAQEWQLFDLTPGATSTLTGMTTGQGYWIEVSEAATLTYGAKTYTLYTGWNLIGWLG